MKHFLSFIVIAVCIFKLVPLLESEYTLTWPFELSSFSLSLLVIFFTAIIMRLACLKQDRENEDKQGLVIVYLMFVGFFLAACFGLRYLGLNSTWVLAIFTLLTGFTSIFLFIDLSSDDQIHKRGRKLIHFDEARRRAGKIITENDSGLFWGGLKLPSKVATSHFCVVGSTGSGKTISLRLFMQSVLPKIKAGSDSRAIIYDAKQDMLSILKGICPETKIVILNPFDKRGVAWNMAADIDSPATAQQVATILIPEEKQASQPFFADAARHLLTGVMVSFIKNSPNNWDFRDLIFTMKNADRLKGVLSKDESTKDLLEYFENKLTAQNIMSTVATKLQRYEFIAAAWSDAEQKISLKDWVSSEYILVLGNDEATRTALDAVNRVIFRRLSELILDQSESETRRTWIFLDEVREMGHLEGLSRLLTKGRSKGTSVVLGFQDIEGLREVYGDKIAGEITGQCSYKAILRTDSPETAKWASSLFGESEFLEMNKSSSESEPEGFNVKGNKTKSESVQYHVASRQAVLPSEFMNFPPSSKEHGLGGFYLSPCIGAYFVTASGQFIEEELKPIDKDTENLIKRDISAQYLKAWEKRDLDRLSLNEIEIETIDKDEQINQENSLGILEGVKREV